MLCHPDSLADGLLPSSGSGQMKGHTFIHTKHIWRLHESWVEKYMCCVQM